MLGDHPSNTWTIHAALRRRGAQFYRACRGISSPHTVRTDAGESIAVAGVTVSAADRVTPPDVAEIETSKESGKSPTGMSRKARRDGVGTRGAPVSAFVESGQCSQEPCDPTALPVNVPRDCNVRPSSAEAYPRRSSGVVHQPGMTPSCRRRLPVSQ
jgi:hypothetical protein